MVITGLRVYTPLGEAKLTPTEQRLTALLLVTYPNFVSQESLHTILVSESTSSNLISVYICKLREKFQGLGIGISTQQAFGYGLTIDKTAFATLAD